MDRGISSLVSGMMDKELRMDVLTHNLANVSTVGFKRQQTVSTDFSVFMENVSKSDSPAAQYALQLANRTVNQSQDGVTSFAVTDLSEGPMQYTGAMLDLAIDGDGFFVLQTPDGEMYTRNGQFSLNQDGYLVSPEGYQLLGDGGPIQYQDKEEENKPVELRFDESGNIFDGSQNIGALRIVRASDPSQVVQAGSTSFLPVEGQTLQDMQDGFKIKQGYLEDSNVSAIEEMALMIEIQRSFETYQKLLQQYDQLRGQLIDQVMQD